MCFKTSYLLCKSGIKEVKKETQKHIVGPCQVSFDFSFEIYPRRQTKSPPPRHPHLKSPIRNILIATLPFNNLDQL